MAGLGSEGEIKKGAEPRLIIETFTRGVNQYHKADSNTVTIGRAFDNDIILSDLSVSAHHLRIEKGEIKQGEASYIVTCLSGENGTRIGKKKLTVNEGQTLYLPVDLRLGTSKVRLLFSDTKVERTRVRQCKGSFCFYTSPVWAVCLLMATVGMFIFDQFMNTALSKPLGQYVSSSFSSVLYLLGFFIVVAGISRLATHRWDIVPAISVASLLFLVPQVVEHAGHFLSYYLSSDAIRTIAVNLVNFILLPILLSVFMMRIAHTRFAPSVGVSLLVSAPFMAYQASDFVKDLTSSDFSPLPSYSQSLSSFDIRQEKTVSIDDFIQYAEDELSRTVLRELDSKNSQE